ncbi:hypothetical protein [Streptomyces sp. NPDC056669]
MAEFYSTGPPSRHGFHDMNDSPGRAARSGAQLAWTQLARA